MIHLILLSPIRISFSIEFLIILVLFIYITYLHIQLSKKNFLIKSYLQKKGISDEEMDKNDILQILEHLRNPQHKKVVTKDKMLDRQFSHFLFEDYEHIKLFIHYTAKKNTAEKIIHEGFHFVNSFYKTAEHIHNDELFLIHRHHEHKQYGHYVIVICISKKIYNQYSEALFKIKASNIAVEQILTEKAPSMDENSDEIYTLPKQFIKGYFNYMEGTIEKNPDFNYNYHSPKFEENLMKLKK
ncbi:MAG: hypothetical protein ACP5DQ_11850 [Bacteroidales bacterium]